MTSISYWLTYVIAFLLAIATGLTVLPYGWAHDTSQVITAVIAAWTTYGGFTAQRVLSGNKKLRSGVTMTGRKCRKRASFNTIREADEFLRKTYPNPVTGQVPVRFYYHSLCARYHVTSKPLERKEKRGSRR